MARVKILRINPEWLANLLRLDGKWLVKIDGLPPDARIIGISDHQHFDRDIICLKVESQEFPDVRAGNTFEWMNLDVRITHPFAFTDPATEMPALLPNSCVH